MFRSVLPVPSGAAVVVSTPALVLKDLAVHPEGGCRRRELFSDESDAVLRSRPTNTDLDPDQRAKAVSWACAYGARFAYQRDRHWRIATTDDRRAGRALEPVCGTEPPPIAPALARPVLDRGGGALVLDWITAAACHPADADRETTMTATTHGADLATQAKVYLKQRHPDWSFICSDQGRWWAQRFPVPREMFNKPNLLDADTPEALDAKLMELAAS